MSQRSHHSLLKSLWSALGGSQTKESYKLLDQADAMEATHGEGAVDYVRDRITSANRKARKDLYRLHDELARRRREHGQGGAITA
ncbi:MAG: hypothetical protein JSR45_05115 [Proteobacteria bacterium]|nr:hypothetical protein [Pseudomonadota bacterium]